MSPAWQTYSNLVGRTPIGEGTFTDADGTVTYIAGQPYGERNHKLTVNEMPKHDHKNGTFNSLLSWNSGTIKGGIHFQSTYYNTNGRVAAIAVDVGKNVPHNNIQPAYVLYPCIKVANDPEITSLQSA